MMLPSRLISAAALIVGLCCCATQNQAGSPTPDLERLTDGPHQRMQLAADVDTFRVEAPDSQRDLASIVRSMGNALRGLDDQTGRQVYGLGQQISNASAGSAVTLLKDALFLMLDALNRKHSPTDQQPDRERALSALEGAADALADNTAAIEQAGAVSSALRAATDVVLLFNDAEPPFGEAEGMDAESELTVAEPMSFDEALKQARDDVAKLSQSKWMGSRSTAARALFALGNLLAAADAKRALAKEIAEVRFQAKRLKRMDGFSFGIAAWVRDGLSTALNGLQALDQGWPTADGSVWLGTARSAIASIDERSPLTFQRAAVQDAFRTSVDAFTAWSIQRSPSQGTPASEDAPRK